MLKKTKRNLISWIPILGAGFLMLGSCFAGYAQVSVSGMITGKASGTFLTGANVTVENTFINAISEKDGKYSPLFRTRALRQNTSTRVFIAMRLVEIFAPLAAIICLIYFWIINTMHHKVH